MTRYNSGNRKKAIIEDRRHKISRLVIRGLTQRLITKALADAGEVNIETGESWDLMTINRDVKALRKEWRVSAAEDTEQHIANTLAELAEVKRVNWSKKSGEAVDFAIILKAVKQESEIRGLDAPKRQVVTGEDGKELTFTLHIGTNSNNGKPALKGDEVK